jgi:hypothetical protein
MSSTTGERSGRGSVFGGCRFEARSAFREGSLAASAFLGASSAAASLPARGILWPISFSIRPTASASSRVASVIAIPYIPARPVRPMRWI